MIIHASMELPAGTAALTDMLPEDIGPVVHFWHGGGTDHAFLGIDPAKLGGEADTRQRFEQALRTGDVEQQSVAFAIRLEEELIGYTLLNRYSLETNYSHWHIIRPGLRGAGISSALYPHRIALYFSLFPMTRLIHMTRTRNLAVNRMLDKYLPVAGTVYVEKPDGVASPGEFHLRYVYAADVPGFFERAAELRRGVMGA